MSHAKPFAFIYVAIKFVATLMDMKLEVVTIMPIGTGITMSCANGINSKTGEPLKPARSPSFQLLHVNLYQFF